MLKPLQCQIAWQRARWMILSTLRERQTRDITATVTAAARAVGQRNVQTNIGEIVLFSVRLV